MINTIVFDLGNVLVDFCWEKSFRNTLGLSGEKFEKLADATTRDEDWNRHDKGDLSDEEALQMFIDNDPSMESEIRLMFDNLTSMIEPYDYAAEWIDRLHAAGYKVYILSNFSRKAYLECVELDDRLGFVRRADGAVISYQEQLIKPDAQIFECLFERYSINPQEAVFIDDRADNVAAAVALGMKGIVCQSKEQTLKEMSSLGVEF